MKNFIQPGNTITLAAPAAVTSGSGMLVGAIFGIAAHDAASGDPLETVTTGVFDLNKIGSQAWGVGDKVYWDNTNKRVTKIATDPSAPSSTTPTVSMTPSPTPPA